MTSTPDNGLTHLRVSRPVSDVLQHLLSVLSAKAITIFAVIDHSGEAAKIGIAMPDTKLVIFGNPRAGTPVMLAAPDSALDLPLKILIAQDPEGSTRISYNSPTFIETRYHLQSGLAANLAGIDQLAAAIAAQSN